MTATALLARLRDKGIAVRVEDGTLRLRPASALSTDELAAARALKPELLRLLTNDHDYRPLHVPEPNLETVRAVFGVAPTTCDLEALRRELEMALRDLRDRWAGRQHRGGTLFVRGRPLVDWLRLDDVASLLREGCAR